MKKEVSFTGPGVPPVRARQWSKEEQERYLGELEELIQRGLSSSFDEAVSGIVCEFIALGYPLRGVAAEKDSLLNACFWSHDRTFLLAFDVSVLVFFVEKGAEIPRRGSNWDVEFKKGDRPDSWPTFLKDAGDPQRTKRASEVLQTYVEWRLRDALEEPVAMMVSHLEALGCKMGEQRRLGPEIDYRDVNAGFHFGITCIGTVVLEAE